MAKKKGKKGTLFGRPRSEVVKRPGAFGKKAKAAGMSTEAYANKVTKPGSKADSRTKKQAGLAKAFKTMRAKKKGKRGGGGGGNPNRPLLQALLKKRGKKK